MQNLKKTELQKNFKIGNYYPMSTLCLKLQDALENTTDSEGLNYAITRKGKIIPKLPEDIEQMLEFDVKALSYMHEHQKEAYAVTIYEKSADTSYPHLVFIPQGAAYKCTKIGR